MSSRRAFEAASDLLRRGGMSESAPLNDYLSRDGREPVADLPIDPATVIRATVNGFCAAAAEGHTFADPEGIRRQYGRTLTENYPEAGPAFLRFAQSYWTLKLLVNEPEVRPDYRNAAAMLSQLEEFVAGLFFPTPGPIKIDPALREAKQREILTKSGAPIDLSDFIGRNPILIRDRRR